MPKVIQPKADHPLIQAVARKAAIQQDIADAAQANSVPALRDVITRMLARQIAMQAELETLRK